MNESATAAPSRPAPNFRGRLALVFLFPLLLHLAGLGTLPLIDRDEPRFAEATREMRAGGDWLVPHFNNHYRFDKPPLTYWAQALMCRVFGESERAVRLPSVLASALTSLLLYLWGRRVAGEAVGVWAALIFATALQVVVHSKLAVADSLLVLAVTLGAWAGWEMGQRVTGENAARRRGFALLFTAALALGFLAKGPIGWLPFGMVAAVRVRRGRGTPGWGAACGLLVVAAGLVAVWGVPALLSTHGEYWREGIGKHVIARGLTTFEGHGGGGVALYLVLLPFYFLTVFLSFFPWSLWLPWLARRAWADRGDDLTAYLLGGIAVVFGLFTFYKTRLPHYTLPAFPLLALLLAREWHRAARPIRPFRRAVLGVTAFAALAAGLAFPIVRQYSPAPQLLAQVGGALRPEMEFAAVDYDEPSLVWYFRTRVNGFCAAMPPAELPAFMAQPGPRFCILPADTAGRLFAAPPAGCRWAGEFSGFNVVNARFVHVRLLLKEH